MLNNTKNSTIKGNKDTLGTIDNWYYNNIELKGFSKYIEDAIYCNDRSISSYGGWNPNGGNTTTSLDFGAYGRTNPSVSCPRNVDKFTVSNTIGNGALDYPVGLLTADEVRLGFGVGYAWIANYLITNSAYFLISPYSLSDISSFEYYLSNTGGPTIEHVYRTAGVRPVISLKPGTIIELGDGTVDDPYQIEMED